MLASPDALAALELNMLNTAEMCAEMAAKMLDAEIIAITRKLLDHQPMTPLQQAVVVEARRRDIVK